MGKKKTQQKKIGGAGKAPRSYFPDLFGSHEDDDAKSVEEIKREEFALPLRRQTPGDPRVSRGSDSTADSSVAPTRLRSHSPARGTTHSRAPMTPGLALSASPPQASQDWDFSVPLAHLVVRHEKLIEKLTLDVATLEAQRVHAQNAGDLVTHRQLCIKMDALEDEIESCYRVALAQMETEHKES